MARELRASPNTYNSRSREGEIDLCFLAKRLVEQPLHVAANNIDQLGAASLQNLRGGTAGSDPCLRLPGHRSTGMTRQRASGDWVNRPCHSHRHFNCQAVIVGDSMRRMDSGLPVFTASRGFVGNRRGAGAGSGRRLQLQPDLPDDCQPSYAHVTVQVVGALESREGTGAALR